LKSIGKAYALNCDSLSPSYFSLLSSLDSGSISKSTSEAFVDHNWQSAMLNALDASNTWELVSLPPDKTTIRLGLYNEDQT